MFEPGCDQAAGLRAEPRALGPLLMPVASPAQPARAYEMLCTLASCLTAQGRVVAIVDGTADEVTVRRERHRSAHPGLMRVLQDPSIVQLERPDDGSDWLVMPGADGLQALQETAHAAGAPVALARMLAPFSPGVIVLLFAPAFSLAGLLQGTRARALVPVIEQPQSSIDAYGAVKLLHGAGLVPVLAPLAGTASDALQTVVHTVADTAQRHLGLPLASWPAATWGQRVPDGALARPQHPTRASSPSGWWPGALHTGRAAAAAPSLWS